MSRNSVVEPDCASDDMSTMEKAPIVMLRTVSSERNLCATRTLRAIFRYSSHTCYILYSFSADDAGLISTLSPSLMPLDDLDLAVVARSRR